MPSPVRSLRAARDVPGSNVAAHPAGHDCTRNPVPRLARGPGFLFSGMDVVFGRARSSASPELAVRVGSTPHGRMNLHALGVLEFPRVLELIAGRAISELARDAIAALTPSADRERVVREHSRVSAVHAFIGEGRGWSPEPVSDIRGSLERVGVAGTWLEPPELLAVTQIARSSRLTRDELRHPERSAAARAVLAPFVDRLAAARDLEDAVARAIDRDGNVVDAASPALRRIRGELRDSENRLIRLLERVLARVDPQYRVPDISITIRNGRYVIAIRREGRTAVGGIVHDASGTEATLFIEPPAAVEFGNRVREVEEEERREVVRILEELTDRVRPYAAELDAALVALVELESLYARARFAMEFDCAPVDFAAPADGFVIRRGRHPLLLAQGVAAVPFDLDMSSDERTLLVSGPNTGGKTVLLKAVGLFTVMAQSGVPVPVARGSRLAIFDDVFADIGDEQSIEASLSTFSGHLQNLREILERATPDSLVLIDELGSGTDPAEGAALAGAILEDLSARRVLTLASTHLGALKLLASDNPAIVNASLQFDSMQLAPTYELVKGRPGRSYGLSIARRLRLPEATLARAEERLSAGERELSVLLEELEKREAALRDRLREADAILDDARSRLSRVAEREHRVREREREIERAGRKEARRYLLDARADVEETIRELRHSREEEIEKSAHAARRRIEEAASREAAALQQLEAAHPTTDGVLPPGSRVAVGDWVFIDALGGARGRIVEAHGEELTVAVGAMRTTVPVGEARPAPSETRPDTPLSVRGDLPEPAVRQEVDVRGLRAAELESAVMEAVDNAVRADLRRLRIIHGKGTGALRERVREMLQKEPRVTSFRIGAWNEGGAGVTIAELE